MMFVGVPWVLGWIVRTVLSHQRFMRVVQLKAEANAKLMDRFGQEPGLLEYLKTDGRRELFDVRLSDPTPRMPAPYGRVLTSVQMSAFLLAAGITCLYIKQYVPNYRPWDQIGWLFFGTMGVALGVAALLGAGAVLVAARLLHNLKNEAA